MNDMIDIQLPTSCTTNTAQQSHNNDMISSTQAEVPAYTIGVPKNSGNRNEVCYLGFDSAYVSK